MKTKQQFIFFAYQYTLLHIMQRVCFATCMQQIPYCNLLVAQLIKKFTSFIKTKHSSPNSQWPATYPYPDSN